MPTDLTGIQVTALQGLIQNSGMEAPDISDLKPQYESLAAITPYKTTLVSAITSSVSIASVHGYDPGSGTTDWNSGTAYTGTETVRYNKKIYLSIAAGTNQNPETSTGYWSVQTNIAYTVFSLSYSVPLPTWFDSRVYTLTVNGTPISAGVDYTLSADHTTLVMVNPPLSTDTVSVNLLPRQIFRLLCEDFPVAVGAVPQAFTQYLGNGSLVDISYDRTSALFPAGAGVRLFANVLNQAQAYAQLSHRILHSTARASFGSAHNAAAGATGGFSLLAGNTDPGLHLVGQALVNSGLLINLQEPWVSFSAAGVLDYLIRKQISYVGNIHIKVLGQQITDPGTGQPVTVDFDLVQRILNDGGVDQPVAQSPLDQTLVQLISQQLDTSDVAAVQQVLQIPAGIAGIHTFADLLRIELYWGDSTRSDTPAGLALTNTGFNSLIQAISHTIVQQCRIAAQATAPRLGQALQQMQSVPGDQLNALVQPSTQAQYQSLLNTLGTGSAQSGAVTCADVLGETNYRQVLGNVLQVLQPFQSPGGAASPVLNSIILNLQAVSDASNGTGGATVGSVTLSDGSTGYLGWHTLLIQVKNLTDTAARVLRDQTQVSGLDQLLKPYNILAQTHNTSVLVYSQAPIYSVTGDFFTVVNFVSQLPALGQNTDGFNAQTLIENCCIPTNVTGQAVVAALREARNADLLAQCQLGTDAGSEAAIALPIPDSAPGLIGGGIWPQDSFKNLPSSGSGI
jgi:hypothetical protein